MRDNHLNEMQQNTPSLYKLYALCDTGTRNIYIFHTALISKYTRKICHKRIKFVILIKVS